MKRMTHTLKFCAVNAWIAKHPALSFYVLTLTLSWGYWFTLIALGKHVMPGNNVSHFPGLLGPMLAAMAVTAAMGGRTALRELSGRMFRLRPNRAAKLMLALSPLALGALACVVMLALGKPLPTPTAFAHFPGLPEYWPLLGVVVVVVMVNGFGEETGWRGFLTERLLPQQGRFRATLIVAALWSLWHLPLFWLNAGMAALVGPVLIGWLFALFCGAFVLAQVYIATGRSVLCVALWHSAYNMMVATEIGTGLPAAIVGTVVIVWGGIVAVRWWRASPDDQSLVPLMTPTSAFKSSVGEAAYLSAYAAAMQLWPVPCEELEISSRFGVTHVVASGPKNAPPLVLLHGYWATLTMWTPNISALSKNYCVYAIDVMGQPSKSIPGAPIRNAVDYVEWLTAVLDALRLDKIALAGMSYGGWLALNFAVAAPQRLQSLILLSSAASMLPLVKQFALRGALMMLFPTRFTVNAFMRWLGFKAGSDRSIDSDTTNSVIELTYLGLKHFRFSRAAAPTVFSDAELRAMQVPTLLLMGEHEVIYDASKALSRARRLIPHFEGELVMGCSHEMSGRQHQTVDARVIDFLMRRESQNPD